MTDPLKLAREALKPCPHCGLAHTLKLITAQELAEEGQDAPEPWMHSDSWAVMCDASLPSGPGGCGASGGFYPSEAEAVKAWNRRAAIDAMPAQQAAPVGAPASPHIRAMAQAVIRQLSEPFPREELDLDAVGLLCRILVGGYIEGATPPAVQAPLTPDQRADLCKKWLQDGGASNIVDAYESGFIAAELRHGIGAAAQGGE